MHAPITTQMELGWGHGICKCGHKLCLRFSFSSCLLARFVRVLDDALTKISTPAPTNIRKAQPPSGRMFYHRPSHMSYYAECMVCFEEGRDMCAGPTMKAMEL